MSFREPTLPLRDIVESIELISEFIAGMDFATFRTDVKTIAAVERKLLTISEAATRLGDQASVLCPDRPWHEIRGMGNRLRHQYDRIGLEVIWQTVIEDLPLLKASVQQALNRTSSPLRNPPTSG